MLSNHATDLNGSQHLWNKTFMSSDRFQRLEILEAWKISEMGWQTDGHTFKCLYYISRKYSATFVTLHSLISVMHVQLTLTQVKTERGGSVFFWNNLQIKINETVVKYEWHNTT